MQIYCPKTLFLIIFNYTLLYKKTRLTNKKYMLNFKSNLILKIIINECKDGGYKLLEKSDIISLLPQKYKVEEAELDSIINNLEKNDLISLRYDDDKVYCVCVLPNALKLVENKNTETENKCPSIKINYIYIILIVFIISLLSNLIAEFIASLLF